MTPGMADPRLREAWERLGRAADEIQEELGLDEAELSAAMLIALAFQIVTTAKPGREQALIAEATALLESTVPLLAAARNAAGARDAG